jgi:hypothetical protein
MLIHDEENSIDNFLDVFRKKFANFCIKSPALLSYDSDIEKVIIKDLGTDKTWTYKFDHGIDVKTNIKNIKDYLLENIYPIMVQNKKEYSEYTADELEKIIDNSGITIDQATLLKKEKITKITWRLEKVLVQRDEIFIRNLSTDICFRFKMRGPVTVFLRNIREKWSAEEAYNFFEKNSFLLNQIFSADVFEEMQKNNY